MACGIAALVGAVSWGAPPARAATPVFVSLDYQVLPGSVGCADANGFRNSVQRQLGYDPFRSRAERHVAVQVGRNETGYDGRIQWTDAQGRDVGQRRLTTRRPGCSDIVNNVAFAVAVQIQLLAAMGPPAPTPPSASRAVPPPPSRAVAPPPPPPVVAPPAESIAAPPVARTASAAPEAPPAADASPAPAIPAVTADAPPTSKPPAAHALRLSVGLGPSLALALAPRPTADARLFVAARAGWMSFELAFAALLPVQQQGSTEAGFSLRRYAAAGAACGHGRVFGACVTGVLARLEADGRGVDMPLQPTGFSGQLGVRAFASHDLGDRYFAALRVEGLGIVSRWTVRVNEVPVWTTPRLAALIGADFGARFF